MATNFDFTDKTQQSITDAIQLANDYANAQGPFFLSLLLTSLKLPLLISTPCPSCFRPYQSALTFTFHSIWNSFVRLCHTESRWRFRKFPSRSPIQKLIVRLPTQSPPPDEISLSSACLKTLREAQNLQKTMHDSYIAQDHLLLALLKDSSIAAVLKELGLTEATLKTAIEQIRGNRRVESRSAEQGFDALQKYAVDLTALAEEGKIDPVIGRDNEIRRAIRILCRRYV